VVEEKRVSTHAHKDDSGGEVYKGILLGDDVTKL
jgi:hypothetical protein